MKITLLATTLLLAATALPTFSGPATRPSINPATGTPASKPGELTPEGALTAGYETANEVRRLTFNQHYDEALRCCIAFHKKWKTSASLIPLLSEWVELGRRYPKAKQALVEIRDRNAREFKEGRGYFDLFLQLSSMNQYLQDENATYELFKSFRDEDPALAKQCYSVAESLLVAHGDYQWCYDHLGDPQAKFDSIRNFMNQLNDLHERQAARTQALQKEIAERHKDRGLPPFTPPDNSAMARKSTEDRFVSQTRQLIEILVATGHQIDAEKIRDQAVTALDDPRLKSAVTDAEDRIRKSSGK